MNYPQNKLDPKIKNVWRISDSIWITVLFASVSLIGILPWLLAEETRVWAGPFCIVTLVLYVLTLVLFLFVVTPIRYKRWRYQLSPEFLEIARGIIWRTRTVVPFIRVQNTDTKQGPILRMFGLASVTVSTAAGSMEIPGLPSDEADTLRDKAAEFARIAKEDV